jgi:hypothetical protein
MKNKENLKQWKKQLYLILTEKNKGENNFKINFK